MNKVCFIGHGRLYYGNMREKLYATVEKEILNGCNDFMMGIHGAFDNEALSVCKELRQKYKQIKITVVITSFAQIKPITVHDDVFGDEVYKPYDDVETTMFEIEQIHYKRKITESNKQMIDECNTLICYVNEHEHASGALSAYNYAKKKGLRIVNLYEN